MPRWGWRWLTLNGNRTDNRLENLQYMTHQENEAQKLEHGSILRGAQTWQGKKTHCPKGHPYSEQNTYRTKEGWRQCVTCTKARKRVLP